MTLKEKNYWLDTVQMPKTDPSRSLPENVDVAVIGAGFTGLSAGRCLAKQGASVAILEAETIGWGASSRNGGMVLTGMKLGVNKLMSMYGREKTQRRFGMASEHVARATLGTRCNGRHERLHRRDHTGLREEDCSHWFVHHRDRGFAGSRGPGTQSAQPDDLRFQELPLLLPPHARPTHALRWVSSLLSGNGRHDSKKCWHSAARDD